MKLLLTQALVLASTTLTILAEVVEVVEDAPAEAAAVFEASSSTFPLLEFPNQIVGGLLLTGLFFFGQKFFNKKKEDKDVAEAEEVSEAPVLKKKSSTKKKKPSAKKKKSPAAAKKTTSKKKASSSKSVKYTRTTTLVEATRHPETDQDVSLVLRPRHRTVGTRRSTRSSSRRN
jgi:hypothetical protein